MTSISGRSEIRSPHCWRPPRPEAPAQTGDRLPSQSSKVDGGCSQWITFNLVTHIFHTTCICKYIYIQIVNVCVYIYKYVCVCVFVYCMYACMYLRACMRGCVCTYVHTHVLCMSVWMHGMLWCAMVCCGHAWYAMVCNGMLWNAMACYGMYDMVCMYVYVHM